jgi:hypothetical protein
MRVFFRSLVMALRSQRGLSRGVAAAHPRWVALRCAVLQLRTALRLGRALPWVQKALAQCNSPHDSADQLQAARRAELFLRTFERRASCAQLR